MKKEKKKKIHGTATVTTGPFQDTAGKVVLGPVAELHEEAHFRSSLPSLVHLSSTSKSSTSNLVSSVPFLLPTAHTSFTLEALILQTTPPLPPLSKLTRLRMKSPERRSHSFTVPSSELVITKFLLNWRHVTALWCLCGPEHKKIKEGRKKIFIYSENHDNEKMLQIMFPV